MSYYRKSGGISWSSLLLFIFLFIAVEMFLAIGNQKEAKEKQQKEQEEYNLSISVYISENISVSNGTITGELTNRTNEDVVIEELDVSLRGGDFEDTLYTGVLEFTDIIVPANSSYRIYSTGNTYVDYHGKDKTYKLKHGNISTCIIDGEEVELMYFDGENFIKPGSSGLTDYASAILNCYVMGIICSLCAILCIIYKIRKKVMYLKNE